MPIKITLHYPKTEVRQLVKFAGQQVGVDLNAVQINVKNTQHAYRGRAYSQVPSISPAWGTGVQHLVVVAVGSADHFPVDNLVRTLRWLPDGTSYDEALQRANGQAADVVEEHHIANSTWIRYGVYVSHPYGGRRSPLITLENWQEAVVAITAHELQHVVQFRDGLPRSEVQCERVANTVLSLWREKQPRQLTGGLGAPQLRR